MRIGNTNKILHIFLILAMLTSLLVAGDVTRVGTSSGDQVKVPVGSRNLAMGGADIATTKNIDAIYWNPAGLGEMKNLKVAGQFSNQKMIADISTNYFAMGFNTRLGVLGISLKTFDFGEIDVTTVENMDGTGETYSPTFATGGITFARAVTDKINFGVTGKLVYESIPRCSGTAFAVDFGIQYKNVLDIDGLNVGICVKNIGSNLKYEGSALLTEATDEIETSTTSYTDFRNRVTSDASLPTTMDMGLSYVLPVGFGNVTLAADFQHNNFENDQVLFGSEMEISKMIFLRAGYIYTTEDADYEDLGDSVFGLTLGLGIEYDLMGVKTVFGYSFRQAEYFDNNNTFTIGFEF